MRGENEGPRDPDAVWDTRKTCLGVSLPIEDHSCCVRCDKYRPVSKIDHDRVMIPIECVDKELTGDSRAVESYPPYQHQGILDVYGGRTVDILRRVVFIRRIVQTCRVHEIATK